VTVPTWNADLLSVVAARTGLTCTAGRWGTALSGHNLGIAALAAVLRHLPEPSPREKVEHAVVLAVLPRLLRAEFGAKTGAAWRQAIGAANMAIASISELSIPWIEVLRSAVVQQVLVVAPDDRWGPGQDVHDAPSRELDARALVALSWLASSAARAERSRGGGGETLRGATP